jgi:hypothetical protein
MIKEMISKEEQTNPTPNLSHQYTPTQKLSRSDVHFPLTTPRRTRAPSITSLSDMLDHDSEQATPTLTLRVKALDLGEAEERCEEESSETDSETMSVRTIVDLPLEVQGNILDYIFGDMHAVYTANNSLRGKNVASSMRHPRRKAVSDLALVSKTWRELVQGRIYRHIKIKGTRLGLVESHDFFILNDHLTKHVRHVEFWVPVWGDKASLERTPELAMALPGRNGYHHLAHPGHEGLNTITANDLLGFNFKLSTYSATLQEIFYHTSIFFTEAKIFTLEGGHCKKSNMIRHFPNQLFPNPHQALAPLPNIRTFAMRGAWNIMRDYKHWRTISTALPNIEEWHCGYAKPQPEAYIIINSILLRLPPRLKHLNISLDGMYSKDNSTLGSTPAAGAHHLCTQLGRIAPMLESLTYTGKICSCFWTTAIETIRSQKLVPTLSSVEIVVKSCCRRQITALNPETGEFFSTDEPSSIIADGAGITNMPFIHAFERLTTSTVAALAHFPLLEHIRIRFIDLDSPCALLNPYFQLRRGRCYGLWNEEILDLLQQVRPGVGFAELGDGINAAWRKDEAGSGVGGIYPKKKPGAIKASSYRLIAETRG